MFKHVLFPAIGLTYISNGIQLVLIGWLSLDVLALSPLGVSAIMALTLLPQIALLPFTGRWADKYSPAQLAKFACMGLSASHITLMLSWHLMALNWVNLGFYALAVGACMAVFLPAKDKATVQLLPNRLQKTLALGSAFQFLGLAIGTILAGFVNEVGLTGLLILQFLLTALAAVYWGFVVTSAPTAIPKVLPSFFIPLKLNMGLVHLLVVCAFNGFMHMGFALVLFPVLGVRHWGFDGFGYGLMQAVFSLGAVVVYVANAYRKPQQYPGQALLFCLLYTAAIAYAITREPTVVGSYGLLFLWGVVAGYSASMSRIILHTVVNDNQRGRAVALYQVVLLSMAPLGSIVCGILLESTTMYPVLYFITGSSVLFFALFLFSRQLWSIKAMTT